MGGVCSYGLPEEKEWKSGLGAEGNPVEDKSGLVIQPGLFVKDTGAAFKEGYEFGDLLGEGSFGQVRKGKLKATGEERAIKWIKKEGISLEAQKQLNLEVEILKTLDHPNIMKIYEFANDVKGFFIISEIITGGELFDEIVKQKAFGEKDAAKIMEQLLRAVTYCHSKSVVHRDLKPENILIDSREDSYLKVKIIDFGNALITSIDKKIQGGVGTIYYTAPEVFTEDYTNKCDVWSLGVILYVMLSGQPPFYGASDDDVISSIKTGKFEFDGALWKNISPEAKDLVQKMIVKNPEERLSAEKALNHPWLKITKEEGKGKEINVDIAKNLQHFTATCKLQQATMLFIVSQLMTKAEKAKLEGIFKTIDKNGDGMLSREELIETYTEMLGNKKLAIAQVESMLKNVDIDKSGKIDFSEFLAASCEKKNCLTKNNIKQAFDLFDSDKSGFISPAEVKLILGAGKTISESAWEEIVREVDTNGDGQVSFQEFEAMMMKF